MEINNNKMTKTYEINEFSNSEFYIRSIQYLSAKEWNEDFYVFKF